MQQGGVSPNPPGAFVLTPRALSAERTQWLTDVKALTPRYPFSDGMWASLAARRPVALVATETSGDPPPRSSQLLSGPRLALVSRRA